MDPLDLDDLEGEAVEGACQILKSDSGYVIQMWGMEEEELAQVVTDIIRGDLPVH